MSLRVNVPNAGKELPEDIYVVIEIPANADPIKYEIDKDPARCSLTVSCPPPCSIRATTVTSTTPCLWTVTRLTKLVPTPCPLKPGSVIRCRPVGVLKMTDEAGEDAKLVAVPHTKLSKEYDHIKDVNEPARTAESADRPLLRALQRSEKRANGLKLKAGTTLKRRKAEIIASFERAANNKLST